MSGIFVAKLLPLISINITYPRLDDKEKYISNNISVENGKAWWSEKMHQQPTWLELNGEGGLGLSKNWVTLWKWWEEACHFLITLIAFSSYYFISIAFTVCGGKGKFLLLHFGSSVFWVKQSMHDAQPSLYTINPLYHLYISNPFW